jgi:hypothetical protein
MNEQEQRVRDYYEKLSLPQERLERLVNIESHEVNESSSNGFLTQLSALRARFQRSNTKHWNTTIGIASICFVVLTLSYFFSNGHYSNEHTQRTLREVAMNHTTRLEPEFRGESLAMLDNSMQQLPFTLSLPSNIDTEYKLIGSRYCSLSGELAAHVRLKHTESGKPLSLFVTSNGAALEDVQTQQTTLEGIDVELWREGGLFFALAQRS